MPPKIVSPQLTLYFLPPPPHNILPSNPSCENVGAQCSPSQELATMISRTSLHVTDCDRTILFRSYGPISPTPPWTSSLACLLLLYPSIPRALCFPRRTAIFDNQYSEYSSLLLQCLTTRLLRHPSGFPECLMSSSIHLARVNCSIPTPLSCSSLFLRRRVPFRACTRALWPGS